MCGGGGFGGREKGLEREFARDGECVSFSKVVPEVLVLRLGIRLRFVRWRILESQVLVAHCSLFAGVLEFCYIEVGIEVRSCRESQVEILFAHCFSFGF